MSTEYVSKEGELESIAWIGGSVHRVLFDGELTGGRLTAFRSSMRAGAASPVHVHDHEDETMFFLSGAGVSWVGDQRFELGAGDSIFLPRHIPHSYTFTEDTELIVVCNPSGMEGFFRSLGWDLTNPLPEDWTVDLEALRAEGEATGQHTLGPPLGPDDQMPRELVSGTDR